MIEFSTSSLRLLLTQWERKSDVTITPEEEILVAAALRHANVSNLAESIVPDIIGPLLCVNDEDSLEFPLWWMRAVSRAVEQDALSVLSSHTEREDEIDWWQLKLSAVTSAFFLLVVATIITFWQPIEDRLCRSLVSQTISTNHDSGFLHQWLNCPSAEVGPEEPTAEPTRPTTTSQGIPYTDPIKTAVVLPLRQPSLMFRESELAFAEEVVDSPRWWLLPVLPLIAGFLTWWFTRRIRKKLEQSQTRQQTESQIIDRLSLSRSSRLFVGARELCLLYTSDAADE